MRWLTRPNDVWLRIWLIIIWIALSAANWWLLYLPIPPSKRLFGFPEFELFLFTIILTVILMLMWLTLKSPDCKCWDDINVKTGEQEEA